MKFEYPIKSICDGSTQSHLGSSNMFGFYPLSRFNSWHGGYHVEGKDEEIRAIAEGKIIAYRLPTDNTKETIGPDVYFYSNGFVLIQHEYKSPKGQDLTFFSLYMHLLPKEKKAVYQRTPPFLSKQPGIVKGLNARDTPKHVYFVIPKKGIVTLDTSAAHWDGSAKYKKVTYQDLHGTVWNDLYVAIDPKYVKELGGNRYEVITEEDSGLSAESYSFNPEIKCDKVVSCNIPVKAGELIGWSGQYTFEKQPDYCAAHIEVFTADDPTSFLGDVKKDGEMEKHYFKLKVGAVLKRAYPWKIPGDSKVKVTAGEDYSEVELVSVTKTVLHSDLKANGEVNGKTKYDIKDGASFNRVNTAFGGILRKDSALVLVNKIEGTVKKREVIYSPAAGTEKYWVANGNVPAGETETRDLASDITELYKTKPDPNHLQDKIEKEEIVNKRTFKQKKDPNGKNWYYVIVGAKEGWIKEDDALLTQISAYDWKAFGFDLVRDTEDQYLYDPKHPPQFLKKLWDKLDTNGDKILNSFELRAAFGNVEMSYKLSRLVCQHISEWDWSDKWNDYQAKVKELYTEGINKEEDGQLKQQLIARRDETIQALQKRLHALCFWKEVKPVAEEKKEEVEKETVYTEIRDYIREEWFGKTSAVAVKPITAKPPALVPKLFPVGNSRVYHFHPIAFVEQMRRVGGDCYCNQDITDLTIKSISLSAKQNRIDEFLSGFNETFKNYQINTCIRKAHFFSQVLHESSSLKHTKEIDGESASYAPYFGRGLIQLTLEENYKKYSNKVGEDLHSTDEKRRKLEENPHAVKSAGYFWANNNLNRLADKDDLLKATVVVNGGLNGYEERLEFLKRSVSVLNIVKCQHSAALKNEHNFEESEIYNSSKYAFAWGYWNDPDLSDVQGIRLFNTRNKVEAIKGYTRFLELIDNNFSETNWYKLQKQTLLNHLKSNNKILVKEAVEDRLEKLKESQI